MWTLSVSTYRPKLGQQVLTDFSHEESIILCASHQQRIADDILNVSKLVSLHERDHMTTYSSFKLPQNMGLLSIQPVPFELADKISEVISMFSVECQQKAIKLSMRKAASIADLNAGWIEADPGRIAQVLLNLISNALKVRPFGASARSFSPADESCPS